MIKRLLCVILLVALLIGCAPTTGEVEVAPGLSRFIDEEAGVVCWIWEGYVYGGISCIPICCTNLGGSDCDEW